MRGHRPLGDGSCSCGAVPEVAVTPEGLMGVVLRHRPRRARGPLRMWRMPGGQVLHGWLVGVSDEVWLDVLVASEFTDPATGNRVLGGDLIEVDGEILEEL